MRQGPSLLTSCGCLLFGILVLLGCGFLVAQFDIVKNIFDGSTTAQAEVDIIRATATPTSQGIVQLPPGVVVLATQFVVTATPNAQFQQAQPPVVIPFGGGGEGNPVFVPTAIPIFQQQMDPAFQAQGAANIVALCYDEDGACKGQLIPGQSEYAAIPIRRQQDAVRVTRDDGVAQQAMVNAIVPIQEMAASAGATVIQGDPLSLPFGVTWLIWCSNVSTATVPNDAALPFGFNHAGWGDVFIWAPPAHYQQAPDPSQFTFRDCLDSEFHATALQ